MSQNHGILFRWPSIEWKVTKIKNISINMLNSKYLFLNRKENLYNDKHNEELDFIFKR